MTVMKIFLWNALICLVLFLACKKTSDPISFDESLESLATVEDIELISTIAFGSCNDEDQPQPLWDDIIETKPDLWIWLGDNIYGDTENMGVMRQKYAKQNRVSGYNQMRKTIPILGIWDDHDFGSNNAGKEFPMKSQSRDLMFEFLDVDESNEAWKREGGYQSYDFGPNGKQVKIILLDSRYFRDQPIFDDQDRDYTPNLDGSILGDDQWTWLENELENSEADIHIIANGIQVLHEDHRFEKWNNFPNERKKLLDLIVSTDIKRPILLSGDRHISEVATLEWQGKSISEITSSGLTHSYENVGNELNRHRVGDLVSQKSFGVLKIDWEQGSTIVELRGDEDLLFLSETIND